MHSEIVGAVGRNRQIEAFGQMCDLYKGRDASAIGDVRLWVGDASGRNQMAKLPDGAQVSPAAIGNPPSRTTRACPATSSGEIGSSSQVRS